MLCIKRNIILMNWKLFETSKGNGSEIFLQERTEAAIESRTMSNSFISAGQTGRKQQSVR